MKNSKYSISTALLSQNVSLWMSTAWSIYLNIALAANVISKAYSNPKTNCTEAPLASVVVYASCTKYTSLNVKIVNNTKKKKN